MSSFVRRLLEERHVKEVDYLVELLKGIKARDAGKLIEGREVVVGTYMGRLVGAGILDSVEDRQVVVKGFVTHGGAKTSARRFNLDVYKVWDSRDIERHVDGLEEARAYRLKELVESYRDSDDSDYIIDQFSDSNDYGNSINEHRGAGSLDEGFIDSLLGEISDVLEEAGEDKKESGNKKVDQGVDKGVDQNVATGVSDVDMGGGVGMAVGQVGLDSMRLEKVLRALGDTMTRELKGYGVKTERIYKVVGEVVGDIRNKLVKEFDIEE